MRLDQDLQREKKTKTSLASFWEKLACIKNLCFLAKLRRGAETEIKVGRGDVAVSIPSPGSIVFQEKGYWLSGQIPETAFTNALRWTLDRSAAWITLEHLRYGPSQPVFLFHLAPTKPFFLESVDAHLCGEDTYSGNLTWDEEAIRLHWRIIGPSKSDLLVYQYA